MSKTKKKKKNLTRIVCMRNCTNQSLTQNSLFEGLFFTKQQVGCRDSREGEGKIKGQRRRGGFHIRRMGCGDLWKPEGGKKNQNQNQSRGRRWLRNNFRNFP